MERDMTQDERRLHLIGKLLGERPEYEGLKVPANEEGQRRLLRALFNVRMPSPVDDEFMAIQDEYLKEECKRKGTISLESLEPLENGLYLWKGDITRLRCDAIVNAANSQLLGCFVPCHGCIDNAIHSYAGVQLRLECARLMELQGHEEAVGQAKITPAYNLPCRYVIHTVGPIVDGRPTKQDCDLLASCYRSCLEVAQSNGLCSIAFCCISTGEFHFPNDMAAEIAVETTRAFLRDAHSDMKVVFDVFKDVDYEIYKGLLGRN